MRASTKRILTIGFACLFLLAALLVYGNLVRPALDEVDVLRSEIYSKQNLFNDQREAINQAKDLINKFKSVARLQETLSLAMPGSENTTQAFNQMQAIAAMGNVTIQSLKATILPLTESREKIAQKLGTVQFNIKILGAYDSMKQFVRSLETNVRVANIEAFILIPAATPERPDSYTVDLTVDMFYQE